MEEESSFSNWAGSAPVLKCDGDEEAESEVTDEGTRKARVYSIMLG